MSNPHPGSNLRCDARLNQSRSHLRNSLEFALARAMLATLPLTHQGLFYGRLLDTLVPRLRRIGRANLTRAGFPSPDPILDGVFASIGRLLYSFAYLPSLTKANIHDWIEYDGFEHYTAAKARGRGVLFATGHLGNWELSAVAHSLLTEPMGVVVRPLDNPLLDSFVAQRRAATGNWVIEKKDFARGILRALSENKAVGVLVDQNAAVHEGIFVPFFGTPASTTTVFAKIAHRAQTTVLPGFALWNAPRQKYILKFYPPVELSGDPSLDTLRIQAAVELAIRQHPDQWLWIHRRWKTRPPGEPSLY